MSWRILLCVGKAITTNKCLLNFDMSKIGVVCAELYMGCFEFILSKK